MSRVVLRQGHHGRCHKRLGRWSEPVLVRQQISLFSLMILLLIVLLPVSAHKTGILVVRVPCQGRTRVVRGRVAVSVVGGSNGRWGRVPYLVVVAIQSTACYRQCASQSTARRGRQVTVRSRGVVQRHGQETEGPLAVETPALAEAEEEKDTGCDQNTATENRA